MAAKRYSLVFYAAIIVALLSTFGVYRVLEVTKANARVATAPVVIAQKDLTEGASIDRMAVVVAQWPVGTIPAGAFTSIDSVAGRVTRVAVFKGEALVPGRLAPDGTGPGLEVKITPGKRAFAFRINDVSGIAGLIELQSELFELGFGRSHEVDRFFLRLPLRLHSGRSISQIGNALLDFAQARFRLLVFFPLQCLPLNLELNDFAFQLIDLLRQRIDLDAES